VKLLDVDSVFFEWSNQGKKESVHHIGIFYKVLNYENEIKSTIEITEKNDDSKGARFYKIDELKKSNLSAIAVLILEKLGYILK